MIVHNLKIKYLYAKAIVRGDKRFELRKDDRDFQVGDFIAFEVVEWPPSIVITEVNGKKVGEPPLEDMNLDVIEFFNINIFEITYKLKGVPEYGLNPGYCILGIKPIKIGSSLSECIHATVAGAKGAYHCDPGPQEEY